MKLVFDIDGTLFNARTVALPAFKSVLKHHNKEIPSDSVLLNTLGYPINEIWEMLLPELSIVEQTKISKYMGELESQLIKEGKGQLFSDVKETLQKLFKQGHQLYTLSNCDEPYMNTIIETFGLKDLFTGLHCAGMYPNETKAVILKRILKGDRDAIMIGDRFHDIEAGNKNNVSTIYCDYGYSQNAEIVNQDYTVNNFNEILSIVEKLSSERE